MGDQGAAAAGDTDTCVTPGCGPFGAHSAALQANHLEHTGDEGSTPDHSEHGDDREAHTDEDEAPLTQGWVRKRQRDLTHGKTGPLRHFRRWSRRWMVVGRGRVLWYMSETKEKKRADYSLVHATVEQHHYSNTPYTIIVRLNLGRKKGKELSVELESDAEMREWLVAFQTEIAVCSVYRDEERSGAVDAFGAFLQRRMSLLAESEAMAAGKKAEEVIKEEADAAEREAAADAEAAEGHDEEGHRPLPSSRVSVPTMNICILAVGTRGDVQPFTALGKVLREYGHRVRLATHAAYRETVMEAGLEYYPLAGDPKKLSGFMVKSQGRLIPDILNPEEIYRDLPEKMSVIRDILYSTWPACTAADPADPHLRPFLADAIISNPVSYGHIHCAEALNVPLHMMFPQPWSPTKAFPHPLSNQPQDRGWHYENYSSYLLVDEFMWLGTESFVNQFRKYHLGLEAIRRGEGGGYLLNANKVPFAKMWSPSLVPRPKDWGPHIDIVGNFFTSDKDDITPYDPSPELAAFLDDSQPPIFVGFGSMIIEDTKSLVTMIVQAAERANVRVLLQSSWSEMRGDALPDSVFPLGNCPHDWLMPQMAAVVHHGGAGTVAAGLRAGKPTMVCPFFGDQHFWGAMVHRAGVGVRPCPIVKLTADILTEAFAALMSPPLQTAAEAMARKFDEEDGVHGGFDAFHRHLPVEDMVCDVSLFQKRSALARVYCSTCHLKLSLEADHVIHDLTDDEELRAHVRNDYRYANLGVVGPATVGEGFYQGLNGFVHETGIALGGIVREPVRGAMRSGVSGAAYGTMMGIVNLVRRPIKGGVIMVDKIGVGIANQVERDRTDEAITLQPKRYIFRQKFLSARREAYEDVYQSWTKAEGTPNASDAPMPSFLAALQAASPAATPTGPEATATIEEFRQEGIGGPLSPLPSPVTGQATAEGSALTAEALEEAESDLATTPHTADVGPGKRPSWRKYLGFGVSSESVASSDAPPGASPAVSGSQSAGHARLPATGSSSHGTSQARRGSASSLNGVLGPVADGIHGIFGLGSHANLDVPRPARYNEVLNPLDEKVAQEILEAFAKAREVQKLFVDIAGAGSEYISKDEILGALGAEAGDTTMVENLVETLDTSGDGRLNFAEFCLMIRNLIGKHPDAFDNRFVRALAKEKRWEEELAPEVRSEGRASSEV